MWTSALPEIGFLRRALPASRLPASYMLDFETEEPHTLIAEDAVLGRQDGILLERTVLQHRRSAAAASTKPVPECLRAEVA